MNLEISGGGTYEYILKEDGDKLNIYGDGTKDKEYAFDKYDEASDVYITLKNYFRKVGRYDQSGGYFIQEWRVRGKKYKLNKNYRSWLMNRFFDYFSRYGESWFRVLVSAIVIVLFFAFAYFVFNTITPIPCIEPTLTECLAYKPPIIERIKESIYFSIVTFTTLGYGDFHPKPELFSQLIAAFEAFIGMFTMAFFTITVARRIMR